MRISDWISDVCSSDLHCELLSTRLLNILFLAKGECSMSAEKGSAFLLKVGDGGSPVAYATVAGLRTTQLSVNGEAVNVTNKDSGGWRELQSGAGVQSETVVGAGIFKGSAGEVGVWPNAAVGGRMGRGSGGEEGG